ncbi:MAG: DNA primase [Bilifractor sp.]|nr:DNA primase [Lachnospiraceae bacterium]MDY2837831.1 DNA primase [Bilifractor sp.]
MRYTDEVIEDVRERNDIVDVISQYVKLQKRGSNYFGLCPFHNEKSPSFSVNRDKQMYYCFGCGKGGNVYTFLMEYENFSFQEAIKALADRAGVKLPEAEYSREEREEQDKRSRLLEINKEAAMYFYSRLRSPAGQVGLRYLKGRGLTEETMRNFGLGYADKYSNDLYQFFKKKGYSDSILKESGLFHVDEKRGFSDKFWNRVMFPIMDANSRVIGFGGRVMGDGKPKYLNSPETLIFDKSRNLYGLNVARRTRRKNFIICEGYMDVISMHQAGYTNAVASLGTALTSQQCSLMSRFTKQVLVIYDMDGAGVKAALRAIPMLRTAGLSTKVVNLRPHKDPDEFIKAEGAEAFEQRLEEAENSFLFMVRMTEQNYDMNDPGERSRFFHEVAVMLLEIEDEIERNSYTEAIARKYHIEQSMLASQINKEALKGVGRTEIRAPKSTDVRRQKAAMAAAPAEKEQKLMLTWIAGQPGLLEKLKDYLSPVDFTNPMYREVAEMVWEQGAQGKISPAAIINHFEDSAQQTEAASLFNTDITLDSPADRKKALFDVLCRMKRQSIDKRADELDPADMQGFMKIMDERKKLDQLRAKGLPENIFS